MSRWLFLPNHVSNDLKILGGLSDEGIRRFAKILDSESKKKGYRFYLQISESLGISDQAAASLYGFCEYVQDERIANKKSAADVCQEIETFLKSKVLPGDPAKVEAATSLLAAIKDRREALQVLFGELPEREKARKVHALQSGPLPHLSSFKTYCDVRPVFSRDGKTVEELITVVTMKITSHTTDSEPQDMIIQLSESDLQAIRKELTRLRSKLKAVIGQLGRVSASLQARGQA